MSAPAKSTPVPLGNGMSLVIGGRSRFLSKFPFESTEVGSQLFDLQRAHRRAFEVGRDVELRRAELAADGRLSDSGKAEALKEFALARSLRSLRDVKSPVTEARQRLAEKRAALLPVRPREPGDVSGALLDSEIRAFARSLPEDKRLESVRRDPELRAAVLRAPAALSGLSDNARGLLARDALATEHGPELAKLEEIELGLIAAEKALAVVEDAVREVAGLEPKDEPPAEEG